MKKLNVYPTQEPKTISVKETVTRSELRVSAVDRGIDIRIWDIDADGNATPRNGGYQLKAIEARVLAESILELLKA